MRCNMMVNYYWNTCDGPLKLQTAMVAGRMIQHWHSSTTQRWSYQRWVTSSVKDRLLLRCTCAAHACLPASLLYPRHVPPPILKWFGNSVKVLLHVHPRLPKRSAPWLRPAQHTAWS